MLLTSLGAGGEGLNLTFANHIVLMEPYWNLAAEQQAIDRVHRIGQTQTTFVLRMYMMDSIELWVRDIQYKKNKELRRLLCRDESLTSPASASASETGTETELEAKAKAKAKACITDPTLLFGEHALSTLSRCPAAIKNRFRVDVDASDGCGQSGQQPPPTESRSCSWTQNSLSRFLM